MTTAWRTWIIFGLAVGVTVAAIGWISGLALLLDRAEASASQEAAEQENLRLALWRMESLLAPLIPRESARPYFFYRAFYPAGSGHTCISQGGDTCKQLVPSPLLARMPEDVSLHFQIDPDGNISSPQVPPTEPPPLAGCWTPTDRQDLATARLLQLGSTLDRDRLLTLLPGRPSAVAEASTKILPVAKGPLRQVLLKSNNLEARRHRRSQQAVNFTNLSPTDLAPDVWEGPLEPFWSDDLLLLGRQVSVGGRLYVQGCWLDWPAIRRDLLASTADLLPGADLRPAEGGPNTGDELVLAALPIRLLPGPVANEPEVAASPLRLALAAAWVSVGVAVAAVAALLRGAMALSARRGAFVSAVTHELRTPLTTFQLYTEMLAKDMITDVEQRRTYLSRLHREALRLGHLVENVLGFARLEGGVGTRREPIRVDALLEGVAGRSEERAAESGMELVREGTPECTARSVRADTRAVEQILFNLVDNACKYAAGAEDSRIHVRACVQGKRVALHVRDHGPGVPPEVAKRLFQPFCKSDRDAADSAPGVGLGLAFSRQLAREMGGDLRWCPLEVGAGTSFELSLPTA